MQNFVRVAGTSDLKPGENKVVDVNGEQVALFNVDGKFFALSNTCPHRGGPLGEGALEEDIVTCPWHGWRFNVRTGINAVMPTVNVKSYPVKVDGDSVLVSLEQP